MFEFIENYDIFIFDFDGCILNNEYVHYKSYKTTLEHFNINIPFEYDDYVQLFHSCNLNFTEFIKSKMNYDDFYNYKSKIFENLIHEIDFIDGAKELLELLISKNKKISVATNASLKRVNLLKKSFPLLNKIQYWITKDHCKFPKPNPECFLKAIDVFYNNKESSYAESQISGNIEKNYNKIIVFEDSYKGFKSIENLPVDKILIQKKDYYFYNSINCLNKYENFFQIKDIVQFRNDSTRDLPIISP